MVDGVGGFALGGYSGFERIGRGGFSTVYRARQDRLGRDVAVKVLSTDLTDPADVRRFETECIVLGRLGRHRNVVDVYDAGVSPTGHPYIVMKLYPGGTLADRIKTDGPMPVGDVVDMGTKIASAVAAAHAEGVVHRDIKPENVLIEVDGEPVVTDFGVAAIADPDGHLTSSVAFTRAYVAPEVLDRNEYGTASDIYSLGATLYTMLSGRPVFQRTTEARVVIAVLQEDPEPIGRAQVPALLEAIVMRCLAKDPADRYGSAEEVRTALTTALAGRPTANSTTVVHPEAAPKTTWVDTGEPDLAAVEEVTVRRASADNDDEFAAAQGAGEDERDELDDEPEAAPEGRGSRRLLLSAGVVATLLILGAAIWGVMPKNSAPEPAVAARVGSTIITQAQVTDASAEIGATLGGKMPDGASSQSDVERLVLEKLILIAVVDAAAGTRGITFTDAQLSDARKEQVKATGGRLIERAAQSGIAESSVDAAVKYIAQSTELRSKPELKSDSAFQKYMTEFAEKLGVEVDPQYGQWSSTTFAITPLTSSSASPAASG